MQERKGRFSLLLEWGASWYIMGGAFSALLNREVGWINSSTTTGSGVENVVFTGQDDTQFGFTYPDNAYYGYFGGREFEEKRYEDLRAVISGHSMIQNICVLDDSDIYTIEDLVGKKIAIGPPGSGTNVFAQQLMEFYGFEMYKDWTPEWLSHVDGVDALRNRTVDAHFLSGPVPYVIYTELAMTHDVRFIGIEEEKLEGFVTLHPYWFPSKLEAGAYRGHDEDILVVGTITMIVTNKNVPDDVVYELVRVIYDNPDKVTDAHASYGPEWIPENALKGIAIPLHPGAVRALEEFGVDIPENLIP